MKEIKINYESLVQTIKDMNRADRRAFFLSACLNADLNLCQACLDANVGFVDGDIYGQPFFVDYVESPRAKTHVIDWLIANGLDINYHSANYATPLKAACMRGNLEIVRHLINKGATFTPLGSSYSNYRGEINWTLNHSVRGESKHYNIIKLLLETGAPLNAESADDFNPLYVAVREKRGVEFVKLFLQYNISANLIVRRKHVVSIAVFNDDLDTVRVLLENNADANVRLEDFEMIKECHGALTPMDIAIFKKNEAMQKLLSEYGGVASSKNEKLNYLLRYEKVKNIHPIIKNVLKDAQE